MLLVIFSSHVKILHKYGSTYFFCFNMQSIVSNEKIMFVQFMKQKTSIVQSLISGSDQWKRITTSVNVLWLMNCCAYSEPYAYAAASNRQMSSKYDISKIRLCQSVHIYLQNNQTEFLPNAIWNKGALGFFVKWCHGHHLESMTSYISVMQLHQLMHIY